MIRSVDEQGQALVEFGIIVSILFIMSLGLLDVTRAFLGYNAISNAARYGARFGAVVGGTCSFASSNTGDWCSQVGQNTSQQFWKQDGNRPLYTPTSSTTSCPHNYDATLTSLYYTASSYTTSTQTTIVGAVAQRFDTGPGTTSSVAGASLPGLHLSRVYVCIQLPNSAYNTTNADWEPAQGQAVTVFVYYRFDPINTLITKIDPINMVASSEYTVE